MVPVIDLVFFAGCPNLEASREALRQALAQTGLPGDWREWRSDDPALPPYAVGFGSPSIFIAGREVTGAEATGATSSCRLYRGPEGAHRPAPDPAQIVAALAREVR